MSGIMLNIISAAMGGSSPVGVLASIRDTRTSINNPKIAIRNDALTIAVTALSPSFNFSTTVARLPLDLSAFTWQTGINTANEADGPQPAAIAIDSAGNSIVAGSVYIQFNNLTFPYLAKVNSSGTFQWHRYINQSGSFSAVTTDSSDAIYPIGTGRYIFSNRDDIIAAKYDSSGTRQFLRVLGDTSLSNAFSFGQGVALLNNTNYCVASLVTDAGSNYDGCLWTLAQSDGAKVGATFQRDAANLSQQDGVAVIRGESADIFYYLVNTYAGSFATKATQVLLKFTTAGGFVWQRFFTDPGAQNTLGYALCMDPSNTHVYVTARTTGAVGDRNEVLITKWTIDGALVWQRGIISPTNNLTQPGISVDSFDQIYVAFMSDPVPNGNRAMILKMPGDGSGSGNFATIDGIRYDYIATSRTASTDALTIADNPRATQANSSAAVTPGSSIVAGALALAVGPF